MTARPDWDEYFLGIAQAVSVRADCTRRKVGAVIVYNGRIVSTGYNGSPPGAASCLNGHCPRGRMSLEEVPSGTPYGSCIAVHAERNAILYAPQDKLEKAVMYVWGGHPCDWCLEYIKAVGIIDVVSVDGSAKKSWYDYDLPLAGQPGAHTAPLHTRNKWGLEPGVCHVGCDYPIGSHSRMCNRLDADSVE